MARSYLRAPASQSAIRDEPTVVARTKENTEHIEVDRLIAAITSDASS